MERLRQDTLDEEKRLAEDEKELIELIQRQHATHLKRKQCHSDLLVQSLADLKDRKDRKRVKLSGFSKELDDDRADFESQLTGTLGAANDQLAAFETVSPSIYISFVTPWLCVEIFFSVRVYMCADFPRRTNVLD